MKSFYQITTFGVNKTCGARVKNSKGERCRVLSRRVPNRNIIISVRIVYSRIRMMVVLVVDRAVEGCFLNTQTPQGLGQRAKCDERISSLPFVRNCAHFDRADKGCSVIPKYNLHDIFHIFRCPRWVERMLLRWDGVDLCLIGPPCTTRIGG